MKAGEARHGRSVRCACLFRIKPELKANYSIHFRDDGTLFSYFECRDPDKAFAYMARQAVNGRWQQAMERFFVKKDSSILGPETVPLEEVFYLK